MLFAAFFSWWYGDGWKQVAASFTRRLQSVSASFSAGQLLRTLFAPWRRIISYPGASLGDRFRAWTDNLFSRAVGFVVRLLVLFTALIALIIVSILSIIELIVWPFVPLTVPVLLIIGVVP